MDVNNRIMVLDEGIDEDIEEMTTCCKTGGPVPLKTVK